MKRFLRRWLLYPIFIAAGIGGGAAYLGYKLHDPDKLPTYVGNAGFTHGHTATFTEREQYRQYVVSDEPNYWMFAGGILGGVLSLGFVWMAEKQLRLKD